MSSEKKIVQDSTRAWMVLATLTFSLMTSGGLQLAFGLILSALVREFGESKSKTAWVGALVMFFSASLSPLTIFLTQRHGIRTTQFAAGTILTLGLVATSMVNTIDYMFLTYGVLVGISCSLLLPTSYAVIPEYFEKKVSMATGISSSSTSIGLIVFSFILPTMLDELGWRKALWCLAAMGPLICVFGLALPKSTAEQQVPEKEKPADCWDKKEPWWKCIKKKAYLPFCISLVLYALVDFVPLYFVPICATESGIPSSQAKWFNIAFGLGSLFGKFLSGPISEPLLRRDKCKYLFLTCLVLFSLSSFLVSFVIQVEWLMAYMAFLGLLNGYICSTFFLVTLEVVGLTGYQTAYAINFSLCSISWTVGPPLAGLLYENLPQVHYLLLYMSAMTFLAAIFCAIIPCLTPRRSYMLHQSDYDYWRVYCRNMDISPRPVRQTRVFTIKEAVVNMGFLNDEATKSKMLSSSTSEARQQ